VVRLDARILQVREIDAGQTVGYGATHKSPGRARIATVGVGYADGLLRSLSNRGSGHIGDHAAPLVGRVSMDLTTFDVTDVPEAEARPGAFIELIGPHRPLDRVAEEAGTIGYELLTALGRRYHRVYSGGGR
jgi:alanine racemase